MACLDVSQNNKITQSKLNDPLQQFEQKLLQFLQPKRTQQHHKNISLEQLNELNCQFNNKLNKIDWLNKQFQINQQKMFLKTFVNIMDKMSNQLKNAVLACHNIDEQIKKDPKCILLANKLKYFKAYYLNSGVALEQSETELKNQAEKNKTLIAKKKKIMDQFYKIQQRSEKRKRKNFSLFVKDNLKLTNHNIQSLDFKCDNYNLQTKPTSNNISRKISLNESKISQAQLLYNPKIQRTQSLKAKSLHRQTRLSDLYKQMNHSKLLYSSKKSHIHFLNNSTQQGLFKIKQFKENQIQKIDQNLDAYTNKRRKARTSQKISNKRKAHTSQKRVKYNQTYIQNSVIFDQPVFERQLYDKK